VLAPFSSGRSIPNGSKALGSRPLIIRSLNKSAVTGASKMPFDARLRIRPWGFPVSTNTLQHHHQDLRDKLGLDRDFTIHSQRHTMLTRLGESGADAFTIRVSRGTAASQSLSVMFIRHQSTLSARLDVSRPTRSLQFSPQSQMAKNHKLR
jgi:hypothetical protein